MTTEKLTEGCEMERHSAGGWGSDKQTFRATSDGQFAIGRLERKQLSCQLNCCSGSADMDEVGELLI